MKEGAVKLKKYAFAFAVMLMAGRSIADEVKPAKGKDPTASKYSALKITGEMERAVIEHLKALGALSDCYGPTQKCDPNGCPPGQTCKETIKHNCVCSNSK
jgi:hypothetical protein